MNKAPFLDTLDGQRGDRSLWHISWPLVIGVLVYLFSMLLGRRLLADGDTYWHIATGQWILENRAIPTRDPFSHTMPGAAWTAHEWLSEVVLAVAHDIGSWTAVVAITALAIALTVSLLTRELQKALEPVHALLFAVFAVALTAAHLLARPHILAMPLMMLWVVGLVRAADSKQIPHYGLLPVMVVWANLHGGFTLGLALAFAFALEANLIAWREQRLARSAKSWSIFLLLAVGCSLVTPHGTGGIAYTWQIFAESSYALEQIGEWRSPNFQKLQPLEIWLLAGMALIGYKGLRLPPFRLLLLLGLVHMALKHARHTELLGLLAPVFLASALSGPLRQRQNPDQNLATVDRFFLKLANPSGWGAIMLTFCLLSSWTLWMSRARPIPLNESAAPTQAIRAIQDAGIRGPVLNNYRWGGYLIYAGIPPFIDGRADMYRDDFLRAYMDALALKTPDGLEKILHRYRIEWTLLTPGSPAVTLLDHLPAWRRLHADQTAVVHVKVGAGKPQQTVAPTGSSFNQRD